MGAISNLLLARKLRLSWRADALKEMQMRKLHSMLHYAYDNVPFYHRKLDGAGVKPDDIKTLEDLVKIPTTTKSEIQQTPVSDLTARGVKTSDCAENITSGSTGVPLVTYMDKKALGLYSAIWIAVFQENGVRLRDKRAMIEEPRNFPKNKNLNEYIGIMSTKHISIFDDVRTQLNLLHEYRPDIIEGYPSSLMILADAHRKREDDLSPRMIFTLAEILEKASRNFISSAFDSEVIDYYGSAEFSLLAWECHEHSGYHTNADCAIVEFLKNGEVVADNERGEITCTSLINHAMPLIRYRHGDIGVPLKDKCSCGKTLPMMKVVEGRADDFLTAIDGRIISPTVFFPYPFRSFSDIRQFMVIQEEKDMIRIRLVLEGKLLSDGVLESARKEIQRVFGEEMRVEFEMLDELPRDRSGKLKKVVSKIPVDFR
jgi:phenylacetate-CoA ligase